MEIILFDENFEEIGPVNISADFEVGDIDSLNDFEITANVNAYGMYIPNTEYGGVFEYKSKKSNSLFTKKKGWSWRGLMAQAIIEPPQGEDYKVVSGEANDILRSMLSNALGGLFNVPNNNSGLIINNYQFLLYTPLLEGIMTMLSDYGYRLKIWADRDRAGGQVKVYAEAVRAVTLESSFDEDSKLTMEFVQNDMGINHLVCMGKGELQDRQRVDLYIDEFGNVSQTQYYTGFRERTAYYDYASAESEDVLIKDGTKRLKELANSKTMNVSSGDIELEIGDKVVCRYKSENMEMTAPVFRKILKITRAGYKVEYRVKGES